MKTVEFADGAVSDLRHATYFYNEKAPNLGDGLLQEIERLTDHLQRAPEIGSPMGGGLRKMVLRRFPYLLLYVVEAERVLVLCVAHQRMNPDTWRERVAGYCEQQ